MVSQLDLILFFFLTQKTLVIKYGLEEAFHGLKITKIHFFLVVS